MVGVDLTSLEDTVSVLVLVLEVLGDAFIMVTLESNGDGNSCEEGKENSKAPKNYSKKRKQIKNP